MTVVHTPVEGFTGEIVGVSFVDGVGETTDSSALAYFARHGYEIDSGAPLDPADPDGPGSAEDSGLEAMTVDELRQMAAEADIDLEGATRKADIIAAITAALDPDGPGSAEDS